MQLLSRPEYERQTALTRDARMKWWRDARFGLFIHYGLYALIGHQEWSMAIEGWKIPDYEKLADSFLTKPGAAREWAQLAKNAGMKYMVLTTRHHEGFSLWDSKVNPYNSVNYGPKRDIVREFVDACREFDLGVGLYSSLMDWHHPDAHRMAHDSEARKRFNEYIFALNRELLTNYGKIDILWFDSGHPLEGDAIGWNATEMNQRLRALQPDIIFNNRTGLPEDFGTPEGHITAISGRDWEACMTFNGISWGYVDSMQIGPYSYNAQRILRMLQSVCRGGGNLLLNIGPAPDGSVPSDAVEPLSAVGRWLSINGEAVYGSLVPLEEWGSGNGILGMSIRENNLYAWRWLWTPDERLCICGYKQKLLRVTVIETGEEVAFEQEGYRIFLKGLSVTPPQYCCNIPVYKMEFEEPPRYTFLPYCPHLHHGEDVAKDGLGMGTATILPNL
ncbi:MAG: alpha-L-fucosidase [Clostridia bacterium]|nr:alpha-L-fucosidase [Clostridia bacterium]